MYRTIRTWETKPKSVPRDKAAEQRELQAAHWEKVDREGDIFWRNPKSGHLYPQGAAIAVLRREVHNQDKDNKGRSPSQ